MYLREWNSCFNPESSYSPGTNFNEAYSRNRPRAAILIGRYLILCAVFGVDVIIDFLHDLGEWLAAV